MPRNGSGVYSAPPNTLATTLTTIKSPEYNAFVNDLVSDANAARPVVAGGTGGNSVVSAQTALSVVGYSNSQTLTDAQKAQARRNIVAPYVAKSAGYTAVADDVGGILRFTNAQTLALTAAATLGDDWSVTVVAHGGAVAIDPNGSETINGLATLIVPNGSSCTIVCDGSNFFTVIKPDGWQFIEKRDFSAVSAVDFINLAAYRRIRLTGYVLCSVASDIGVRASTDNGATFDSGTNYGFQVTTASSTTIAGLRSSPDTYISVCGSGSTNQAVFFSTIDNMNSTAGSLLIRSYATLGTGGGGVMATSDAGGFNSVATAKNALRLFTITGGATVTGSITIEGSV